MSRLAPARLRRAARRRASEAAQDIADVVFPRRSLARVLGVQYVVGGTLAAAWVVVPGYGPAVGHTAVVALAALAGALGAALCTATLTPLSGPALSRLAHGAILSAQVVVAAGHAATQDPGSPLLLYLLWTTPFAGVFPLAARLAHVGTTTLALGAAQAAMPAGRGAEAASCFVLVTATVVVATLLVSRMTDRLQAVATQDPLTGLPNRRHFHAATRTALARRDAEGGEVAVLLVDLDRFKHVNDSFGHEVGDALLAQVAVRMRAAVRSGDVVARLGGDEFAVLCEDRAGGLQPEAVAARLAQTWRDPVEVGARTLYAQGSIGIALADDDATPETLLRDADTAMYEAKHAGGGRAHAFDPRLGGRSGRLVAVDQGLREAAERDELEVHYQPVVRLADGAVVGVEALLRWTSPELGPVPPDEFIAVAESTGLIGALGGWVLDRALSDLAGWRADGTVGDDFCTSVNVSAHQLDAGLPGLVSGLLRLHGVPARCLGVELTETAVMGGAVAEQVLHDLRAAGVVLVLDDFGTGWSSLSHLRRSPFAVVKVDRSFVGQMHERSQDRALVLGILQLARSLGLGVVAEGVEDPRQLAELRDAGCSAVQGYLLSRPVPPAELPQVLARFSRAAVSA